MISADERRQRPNGGHHGQHRPGYKHQVLAGEPQEPIPPEEEHQNEHEIGKQPTVTLDHPGIVDAEEPRHMVAGSRRAREESDPQRVKEQDLERQTGGPGLGLRASRTERDGRSTGFHHPLSLDCPTRKSQFQT